MRQMGSNLGTPKIWGPSPVWPQGHGLLYARPLIDVSRQALRDWLCAQAIDYIDDPANDNLASLRAKARHLLAQSSQSKAQIETPILPDLANPPLEADQLDTVFKDGLIYRHNGIIGLKVSALSQMTQTQALGLLMRLVVCCGGSDRLPRGSAISGLWLRLETTQNDRWIATIGQTRIRKEGDHLWFMRHEAERQRKAALDFKSSYCLA